MLSPATNAILRLKCDNPSGEVGGRFLTGGTPAYGSATICMRCGGDEVKSTCGTAGADSVLAAERWRRLLASNSLPESRRTLVLGIAGLRC